MIENPRFTFVSQPSEISRLFLAFELANYKPEKSLKYTRDISPFTDNEVVASVFIGNDLTDSKL